jgi:hypothetical protein
LVGRFGGAPSGTPIHSKVYKSIPTTYKYFHEIENLKTSFPKKFSSKKMVKKDEVSKYTIPKEALDMLEWPHNTQNYSAKDIPQIIKKGFKPMTDSNINPPTDTNAVPNPVPGTEVTQSPGLIPETTTQIPGYDPNTSTAPTEYDPASVNVAPATYTENDGSTGTIAPPPTDYAAAVDHQVDSMPSAPPDTHEALMQDPAYAVHIHEQQLNRICDMLEEVCNRVIAIEDKLNGMENDIHFQGTDPNNPINEYPEVSQHQTGGSPGLTV